ncbi:MAG: hypothetical protein ACMXYD_04300 [Candidatus Woesearchaeota archaeon]
MPITAQDVFRVVQQQGPIIPNKIKQILEQPNPTMINVYLSELREQKKIFFTHLQLGTSMFAYTPEQKPKLEGLIEHLNEKDRRTVALLKEKRVLQAGKQEPLVRVSLQETKDFCRPIKVTTKTGEEEIFYRYYLVDLQEAQNKIRELLGQTKPATPEEKAVQKEEVVREEKTEAQKKETTPQPSAQPEKKAEAQKTLAQKEIPTSDFAQQLQTYCETNNIVIKAIEEVRKDQDYELILEVPTAVGKITFFAKAKNKKNSNDGDLASAILKAKTKNLPALYLTTGNVTNKALEQEELQDITVIELGS